MDASYCFMEGHCANTKVTLSTTLEEATHMCDKRYGRKAWTSVSFTNKISSPTMVNQSSGFRDYNLTRTYALMACAMGNYHCDVIYCRETYCKNTTYSEKYHH